MHDLRAIGNAELSRRAWSRGSNVGHQVRHVPNLPQVGIMEFYNIRENRFQPESPRWPIERRYCQANVALTDGVSRDIWYLIEERTGFAGLGANVEFCVAGFDRRQDPLSRLVDREHGIQILPRTVFAIPV
jgi:hypothetical protein